MFAASACNIACKSPEPNHARRSRSRVFAVDIAIDHVGRSGSGPWTVKKGHLGVGADADLTIYNEKPDGEFLFRYPRYVIKAGEIVVEEGEIRNMSQGREFVVQPAYDASIEEYLRPLFQQYYTMSFENYPVELERLEGAEVPAIGRALLNMIVLTLKEQTAVPLEAEALSPDVTANLPHDELRALPVLLGKHPYRVDDFFEVEGEASDELESAVTPAT